MKKTFLILIALLMSAAAITAVPASDGTVLKSLLYNDIKITLDSREIKPADVNGNYIEPFIIEGTTYLPVRGIASSLGLEVGWNGETNTVSLTAPQNAQKTVLYNEDGIKAVYNGFEVTENGVVMSFFVNNGSKDDICFVVNVDSADGRSVEKNKEYIVIRGREVNIRHLVPDVKKADKIKFSFFFRDPVTQLDISAREEFTAIPDSAQSADEKPQSDYSDPEGEITDESFAQFFKAYGEFKNSRYQIESSFTDRYDCYAGWTSTGYSIAKKDVYLESVVITDVYDPVIKESLMVPVEISVKKVQGEEKYDISMFMILDKAYLDVEIEYKIPDSSFESPHIMFGKDVYDVQEKYIAAGVQDELTSNVKQACIKAFNAALSECENAFDEKGSRLSLEFFGLK